MANQLQLSITNTTMIQSGINVNMENDAAVNRDGGVLDFCRLHDITIQPWSPFQYGFFEGVFLGSDKFLNLIRRSMRLRKIQRNQHHDCHRMASSSPCTHAADHRDDEYQSLHDCIKAGDVTLTREEWYAIYRAAGNILP